MSSGSSSSLPRWRQQLSRYWPWLCLALTLLLVLAVRIRLREMPLERDEGEYAYAGQLLLHGLAPFKTVYTMKLPGTFAAYAVIMAIFGQSAAGIHLGVALVNAACIVMMFLLGRRLLDETAAAAAAISFGLMSLSPWVLGLAGHATHFVVLFALGGILALLKATTPSTLNAPLSQKSDWRYIALSGFLFGLGFLMKQHGALFALFGLVFLSWKLIVKDESSSRAKQKATSRYRSPSPLLSPNSFLLYSAFVLPLLLPYLLTCLLLAATGALKPFIFWTVTYAGKYAAAIPLEGGNVILKRAASTIVGPNIVLWLLPWIGMVLMWWDNRISISTRFFLAAFMVCSLISVSLGFYFREHYFIMLLPALSLMTGLTVSRARYLLKHDRTIELFLAVPLLVVFGIGVIASLGGNGSTWFALSPNAAVKSVYGSTLFADTVKAADYIKAHLPENGTVAVLGSEPQIYFLAKRRSATRYIYMYPLMEEHKLARQLQDEMIEEIERARPEYIVYVDDFYTWLGRSGSEKRIFQWWKAYWEKEMDLVATINVEEGIERGSDYKGPEEEAAKTETKHLFIFKRKSSPQI